MAKRLKKKIRRIFALILWGLLIAATGFLLGFAGYEQAGTICRILEVNLIYGEADPLVTEHDIDTLIRSAIGEIRGKPLYLINTEKIEQVVKRQPYVSGVNVYGTHSGRIVVNVYQRHPLIRIITESNRGYYLGSNGALLPLNPDHPIRVPVASGAIPDSCLFAPRSGASRFPADSLRYPLLWDLYKLALFLTRDPFLKTQTEQIFVNGQGDYELVPKMGDHIVKLGNAENLADKFTRLQVFYRNGLNRIGWNKYQVINIKYKNQVVCSKY